MDKLMLQNWIGLEVKIISSPNILLVGKRGKIIDETLNTIVLRTKNKDIIVPKKGVILKHKNHILNLSQAICKPEDRTKKLYKSWLIRWQRKEKEFIPQEG
ncbi:MAG: ribonuclease P protein subunit [Candidatus Micrarchaeota archaeon]|nr:ribonuclease P protein subunit [Candidatus Micrarchaeota archaeon]